MRAESALNPRAVSRAGAMGLMQLMPATWVDLRARLALGSDPFDVRDNIIAGAAYLRDLLARFGVRGGLAAYNAGPGRYADHLATGRPLPAETRAYVAVVALSIGLPIDAGQPQTRPIAALDWTWSPLFADRPASSSDDKPEPDAPAGGRRLRALGSSQASAPDPLFVVRVGGQVQP